MPLSRRVLVDVLKVVLDRRRRRPVSCHRDVGLHKQSVPSRLPRPTLGYEASRMSASSPFLASSLLFSFPKRSLRPDALSILYAPPYSTLNHENLRLYSGLSCLRHRRRLFCRPSRYQLRVAGWMWRCRVLHRVVHCAS